MDKRFSQIKKEVRITIGLYIFYFLWWYFFAFGSGDDPTKYTFILGLPSWFFMSCVVGLFLLILLVSIIIKLFFKNMDLE
ncbi:MAG: DUF997 family protein [Fusobacteriaceae bacterium]